MLVFLLCILSVLAFKLPKELRNPENDKSSLLIVTMRYQPIMDFPYNLKKVYFVKINKKVDAFNSNDIIESNFIKGKYVYLVNAEPGLYAAIGGSCFTQHGGTNFALDKLAIEKTICEVKPASVAYMGNLKVKGYFHKKLNDIQKHYSNIVNGGLQYASTVGKYSNTKKDIKNAIKKAKKHFKKSSWIKLLDKN